MRDPKLNPTTGNFRDTLSDAFAAHREAGGLKTAKEFHDSFRSDEPHVPCSFCPDWMPKFTGYVS